MNKITITQRQKNFIDTLECLPEEDNPWLVCEIDDLVPALALYHKNLIEFEDGEIPYDTWMEFIVRKTQLLLDGTIERKTMSTYQLISK